MKCFLFPKCICHSIDKPSCSNFRVPCIEKEESRTHQLRRAMPTCACENDRVTQKVVDQVVKLVVKRGEERKGANRAQKPLSAIRLATIWDCNKNTQRTEAFLLVLQLGENLRRKGKRFWFLWPQREHRVNHAPFEIAVPHPRSISASSFVRPTRRNSMHANSSAPLITDCRLCRAYSVAHILLLDVAQIVPHVT